MILEASRVFADWLAGNLKDFANADQGINTQLAYLRDNGMLDGGDSMPELVRTVIDITRDNYAARGEVNPTGQFPIVVVGPDGPGDWEAQTRTRAKRDAEHVPFAFRYVTADLKTAKGEADCWYTLRAMVRSLEELMRYENESPPRTRNKCVIMSCTAMRVGPAYQQFGEVACTGGIVAEFKLRDGSP